MMFDYGNANFNNRDVPLFSLDDQDRKIIKKIKNLAGWSFFVRFLFLASYIIGVILTCVGAVNLVSTLPVQQYYAPFTPTSTQIASYNAMMASYKCELAFGIIFLIIFVICIVALIAIDFTIAKHANILKKYDDNTRGGLISRYYWAVAQHKWLFFFFMLRFGFFLDCMIISQCRRVLKLKQLTPQEEQAKEEEWLNNFTSSQPNDRSIAYRLSLRRKKDDTTNLTNSPDPTKN